MVDIDCLEHTNSRCFSLHKLLLSYYLIFALNRTYLEYAVLILHTMDYIVKRLFIQSKAKERDIALDDHQTIANRDFYVEVIKYVVAFVAL